jgi:ABC-type Na+ transport system ATPase subunit NatA
MADTMIEVAGVKKAFGTTKALCGVDLTAERAAVLGLLGPNGAGKTTLVRILGTLLLATPGSPASTRCATPPPSGRSSASPASTQPSTRR